MLKLRVVAPEGLALEQEVDEVTVPGLCGEFGVLPGHVALLAATKAGVVRYRRGSERGQLAVGPGFSQVDGQDAVVVLVDKAIPATKLQPEAAEKLRQAALARLQQPGLTPTDQLTAEADRDWAQAQLDARQ